ncbi:MAG: DUF4198 domain-containing protein [Methanothrix sp.]
MKQLLISILLLMLLIPAVVNAHETFAWPLSGWADVGDNALVTIGSGHNTTSTEMPEGLMYIKVISQSGRLLNHTFDEKADTSGYWKLYDFDVDEPGLYIIDLYHTEGAWTNIVTNPPAKSIWQAGYAPVIDFDALDKTGWADDWYVQRSYTKNCYAKAFVAGPNSDFALASRPIGQVLEIVPLDNITAIGKNDFQFQVLFQGQPMDNLTVIAERVGNDTKLTAVTDEEGRVKLDLTNPSAEYNQWLITTDTGTDLRTNELLDMPRGKDSNEKSYVGPKYITTLILTSQYIKAD